MMTHLDMISLIGDLFMDAYIAGQQTDMSSIQRARADRDRLLAEVRELYRALDDSEEHINDQKRELEYEKEIRQSLYETIRKLEAGIQAEAEIQRLNEDIPDDAFKFSEQDLPFPDVEDLEGASGLLGGDE